MQFRPCIDLHQGKVKQIVGSTLSDTNSRVTVNFESTSDSAYYAKMYKKDQLRGGHVIMLGPGNEESAKNALAAWPGGLQIGGGITAENAGQYLDAGASHVIVTSYVFRDGQVDYQRLKKLVSTVGRERLVLDLSCKEKNGSYYILTDRWQRWTETAIERPVLEQLAEYCDEFLVHAAGVEGKMAGPDLSLVELLAKDSPIEVTYAGGIVSLKDLEEIRLRGGGAIHVTIGSALDLFGGSLSFSSVVDYCRST